MFMIKICLTLNEGENEYYQHVMHSRKWVSHCVCRYHFCEPDVKLD